MIRPPPRSTRTDTLFPDTTLCRATVYNKGAEVIRMMRTLLGPENFRKGADLYFDRHDGQAVTCEDFVRAMEEASGVDLAQFRLWSSQRSEERRVGKECVSTCRSRWSPYL